ncbi:MAG: phage tail tape measure protein [Candidatus Heimdallarchaeaceae archaeon]
MAFKAGAIYGEAKLDTKNWKSGLKTISKGATVAGAAIAAAFTAAFVSAVKAGDEFQKAMSNVATLIDTTQVNMQELSKQIILLNPELGTATELTEGLYQAFSAGATTAEEAMKITTDAAMFGKAALTDTFTAVDVLTTAVNAYGKATMDTTKASDLFFQTIKFGKITGEELAASIGTSIPLYASAGIELEQLAAGLAAMTKQGVNANVATTQLNAIVNAFLKPSEAMINKLTEMGYESGSAFLKAEGLAGALKLVEEATSGDAAEMSKLLPNIRALRGAMALTGVGGEEFTRVLAEMENAAGVTQVAFDKQEKTFITFKNAIANLMVPVGNIGKHFVDKLAVGATSAAQGMLAFVMSSQGMELIANIAGGVAGAFELIKGIVTPLFAAVKSAVTEVWGALKESLAKVFGETTGGAGAMKLLSVVVNLVISGVTVLGTAITNSIKIFADWITAIQESAGVVGKFFAFLKGEAEWQDVKDQARTAGQAFTSLGKSYIESIGAIFKTVRGEVKEFSGETEELATELTGKVSVAFETGNSYVKANWGELLTGQEAFVGEILEQMGLLSEGIKEGNDTITTDTEESREQEKYTWFDFWDELIDKGKLTYKELQNVLQTSFNNGLISLQTYTSTSRKLWSDNWDKQVEKVQLAYDTITSVTSTTFSGIAAIRSQYYENQKAELDLWYQAELSRLQQNFDNQIISEDEFNAEKEKLDKEYKDKKNALAKQVFEADKKNRIIGVISDAASAIMGWWKAATKLGPIAGPIFAGVMTGLTVTLSAAQIAMISRQKFVPAMQEGGTASGLTRINERGGEILNLPGGTIVIPADISREIARAGGSPQIINVSFEGANINSEMDLDYIVEQVSENLGKELRLAR